MVGWVGPAISAVGSVVGGLLGSSSAKKANKLAKKQFKYAKYVNANKIKMTVDDAKRAGIHPLAALGSSASGGFATPVQSYSGNPSWGDAVGSALQGIGQGVSDYQDYRQRQSDREDQRFQDILDEQSRVRESDRLERRSKLEETLLQANINEVRSRTLLNAATARVRAGAVPVVNNPLTLTDAFGDKLRPNNTGAEAYENQYGEIAGEIYGLTNWVKDLWNEGMRNGIPIDIRRSTGKRPGTRFNPGQ